jgi:hypothetical protein
LCATLAAGLFLSAILVAGTSHRPGVYWERVQVHLNAPQSARYPNVLRVSSTGLVSMAAIVALKVDPYGSDNRMASESTTLADAGVRNGWSVTAPNSGGQWTNVFSEPWINVEAVGPDVSSVQTTVADLVKQVQATLLDMQVSAKTATHNLVTTQVTPPNFPVYFQTGSRKRALAMSLILGFSFAGLGSAWLRNRSVSLVPARIRRSRLRPSQPNI